MIGVVVGVFALALGLRLYPDSPMRSTLVAVAAGLPVLILCAYLGVWS